MAWARDNTRNEQANGGKTRDLSMETILSITGTQLGSCHDIMHERTAMHAAESRCWHEECLATDGVNGSTLLYQAQKSQPKLANEL